MCPNELPGVSLGPGGQYDMMQGHAALLVTCTDKPLLATEGYPHVTYIDHQQLCYSKEHSQKTTENINLRKIILSGYVNTILKHSAENINSNTYAQLLALAFFINEINTSFET